MKVSQITDLIEQLAPKNYQESYDNAGFQIGNLDSELTGILFCLDVTEEVVEEAEMLNANLIISHHPLIFKGLKSITGSNYIERIIIKAIKKGISIYSAHTNLDSVMGGVNSKIAQKLGVSDCRFLQAASEEQSYGAGLIGTLKEPMDEMEFLKKIKSEFNCGCLKYSGLHEKPISTVAICGGSGSFLIKDAIAQNADIFLTGEIKYHDFFGNDEKILLAELGHFESEQFTVDVLYDMIKPEFPYCFKTNISTNPINYL